MIYGTAREFLEAFGLKDLKSLPTLKDMAELGERKEPAQAELVFEGNWEGTEEEKQMLERIQKIMAQGGIASRREAERLILDGRVTLNGKVVEELGTKADTEKDYIKVNGRLITRPEPKTYIMLFKPRGYVTTSKDPEGRPTVMELLEKVKVRVFPVGRLDYDTEGLILCTNDGDLAHRLQHPSHEIPKTYLVKVDGVPHAGWDCKVKEWHKAEGRYDCPCQGQDHKEGRGQLLAGDHHP